MQPSNLLTETRPADYCLKERRCTRCREWWPDDYEFFYPAAYTRTGKHSWCKACCLETKRAKRLELQGAVRNYQIKGVREKLGRLKEGSESHA